MFSIIIPTYNEATQIADTLSKVHAAKGKHIAEIIVVDGGSTDDSLALASSCGAVAIKSKRKSRAAQMNQGESMQRMVFIGCRLSFIGCGRCITWGIRRHSCSMRIKDSLGNMKHNSIATESDFSQENFTLGKTKVRQNQVSRILGIKLHEPLERQILH